MARYNDGREKTPDGIPDEASRKCGMEIKRLRTMRDLSRDEVVKKLDQILYDLIEKRTGDGLPADDHEELNRFNTEKNLARFEGGKMVKVPRLYVELLCDTLKCSTEERSNVRLQFDRNPFTDGNGKVTELTFWMNHRMPELRDALENTVDSLKTEWGKLTEQERWEILVKVARLRCRQL